MMPNEPRFPALLGLQQGETLAKGQASVGRQPPSISFHSDFVPLYPIGTPLEILRTAEGKPIHRFWGTVYLSSKSLMRLVSVQDELLPGSEAAGIAAMRFGAALVPEAQRRGLRGLFGHSGTAGPYPITLHGLTKQGFEFEYDTAVPLEVGQEFTLQPPPGLFLPECRVQIQKAFPFGRQASYQCAFIGLAPPCLNDMWARLTAVHYERNKLF